MDGIMQGRMDGGTGEKKDVECFNNTCCRKGYWGVECGNWSVRSARRAVYVLRRLLVVERHSAMEIRDRGW